MRTALATLFLAASGTAWFAWRYEAIGRLYIQNQRELSAKVAEASRKDGSGGGSHIALTLQANEGQFDNTLALGAARRTAGLLALASATLFLVAAGVSGREWQWARRN